MANPGFTAEATTVDQNLAHADALEGMPEAGHQAGTLVPGAPEHGEATIFGVINGSVVVSIAMIVFLAIVLWKGGVRAIVAGLDRQIADIRRQLDEAATLRAEAEALRDEYAKKIAAAETTAKDMMSHAEAEAAGVVAQAKTDADELVSRRARMAEDRIAAAERAALADVRARAASAAAAAAAMLIGERHGADADRALVDRTIAGLGRPN